MAGNTSSHARILPPHGLLNNTVEGKKRRICNDIGKEVTLPPVIFYSQMGKGRGWELRRLNPPPPAFGLLPLHRVEVEKCHVYNDIGK